MFFRRLTLLSGVIICALLTACSGKADVWLYVGERWRVTTEIAFDPATLPKIDQNSTAILPGVTLDSVAQNLALGMLDNSLEDSAKQLQAQNIQTSWQHTTRGKDAVYSLDLSGQGWDKLRQVMTGGPTFISQLPQLGSFEIKDAGNGQLAFNAQMLPGGFAVQIPADAQIKLHAAKIINGNPSQIEGNGDVAVWQDVQTNMNATVIPLSQPPLDGISPVIVLAVIAVVLVVFAMLIFFVLNRERGGSSARRASPRPYRARPVKRKSNRR